MRLKFKERSELKFVSRIIPQSRGNEDILCVLINLR